MFKIIKHWPVSLNYGLLKITLKSSLLYKHRINSAAQNKTIRSPFVLLECYAKCEYICLIVTTCTSYEIESLFSNNILMNKHGGKICQKTCHQAHQTMTLFRV